MGSTFAQVLSPRSILRAQLLNSAQLRSPARFNNHSQIVLEATHRLQVYDSVFRDNYILNGNLYGLQSGGQGGNIAPENDSQGEFYNCLIYNGTATFGGGIGDGTKSASKFVNCSIYRNKGVQGGGYRSGAYAAATFTNCRIYENTGATSSGGVEVIADAKPSFINTVIRDNFAPEAGGFKHSGIQVVLLRGCTLTRNRSASPPSRCQLSSAQLIFVTCDDHFSYGL